MFASAKHGKGSDFDFSMTDSLRTKSARNIFDPYARGSQSPT